MSYDAKDIGVRVDSKAIPFGEKSGRLEVL